jgi:hypothetical protein
MNPQLVKDIVLWASEWFRTVGGDSSVLVFDIDEHV